MSRVLLTFGIGLALCCRGSADIIGTAESPSRTEIAVCDESLVVSIDGCVLHRVPASTSDVIVLGPELKRVDCGKEVFVCGRARTCLCSDSVTEVDMSGRTTQVWRDGGRD